MLKRRGFRLHAFARGLASAAALAMLLPGSWSFAATPATTAPVAVAPLAEIVADRTQLQWSARWWMWASAAGEEAVQDLSGDHCAAGQEGEVFFLAGTFERRPVERTCKVPAGRYLFFPLVNYVVFLDTTMPPCEAVKGYSKAMTDKPLALFAELDGVALEGLAQRRLASECFNINARSQQPSMITASNGYWLMLKPLAKGRHTLHFGGALPSLRQDIAYTLVVE